MPSRIDQRRHARKHKKTGVYLPHSNTVIKTAQPSSQPNSFVQRISSLLRVLGIGILVSIILIFLGAWLFFRQSGELKTTFNIVFVSSNLNDQKGNIILVHASPVEPKIEVALFPSEMPVDILGGYGKYPLRSVFPLLQLDRKSPEFMRAAYSYALQIPIDEVVAVSDASMLSSSTKVSTLWWQVMMFRVQSSLGLGKRLQMYRFLRSVRPDQLESHSIGDIAAWQKNSSQFKFAAVPTECSVAVLNTTTVGGTGSKVTQVLESSGMSVIRLSDTPDKLSQTQILVNQAPPFCQDVLQHVQDLFPFVTKREVQDQTMNRYRANIVVLVGQDFAKEIAKQPKQQ